MENASNLFVGHVRALSGKGLGVVEHEDGRLFFVPGCLPEEEGEFEILSFKKKYGFAKLIKLLKKSPHRVNPPCPHQGHEEKQCGGCPLMILDYPEQLKFKQQRIEYALKKVKIEVDDNVIKPIWASEKVFNYRNRAQFKTDGKEIGFVSASSKTLAPIDQCMILTEKNQEFFEKIKKVLPREDWKPSGKFHWNFIEIGEELNSVNDIKLNKRRGFAQGNSEQNEYMKKWLQEKCGSLKKTTFALELFCGSGNFTEVLAQLFSVVAVEADKESVERLKKKSINEITPMCLDLFEVKALEKLKKFAAFFSLLVLDPPREGFPLMFEWVKELTTLEKIFYISCDVETFARDIKSIEDLGWKLQEVQPLDQFPHTAHGELLAVLEKN